VKKNEYYPIELAELEKIASEEDIKEAWFEEFVEASGENKKYGYQLFIVTYAGELYSLHTQRDQIRRFSNICYAHKFMRRLRVEKYFFINIEFEHVFNN